jgi:hypothetical protein
MTDGRINGHRNDLVGHNFSLQNVITNYSLGQNVSSTGSLVRGPMELSDKWRRQVTGRVYGKPLHDLIGINQYVHLLLFGNYTSYSVLSNMYTLAIIFRICENN